jgi:tyrosinase
MFERRDVWKLTEDSEENPWHPIIEWYARAVTAMQGRDGTALPPDDFVPSDPTSWRYLAEIHGTFLSQSGWPSGATWNECQHFSWFFLPWHRIYLHYFESVVRQTITDLGGPDDWALPYWDYSDANRPNVRRLPPAFRVPLMPSGDPNPLFVTQRVPAINAGGEMDATDVEIGPAMSETLFTGFAPAGWFGGPATAWSHVGSVVGTLEREPHGTVHVEVGGQEEPLGWMSRFETAARDPIFWLHHANIDRLWEAWLALGDGRTNPSGRRADPWLNSWFKVGGGASAVTLRVREMLDTRQPPLNYFYSDVSVPEPARAAVLAASSDTDSEFAEEEQVPQDISPEMVGASEPGVPLASTPTEVEVAIEAPSGPALTERAQGAQTRKVYLQVENVRGRELAATNYSVYVNLPPGADPTEYEDRRVGQVSMFGVREASRSDEGHSGSGLTFSFDITGVVEHLVEAGEWAPERLRVTFTPVRPSAEQGGDVSVGQVSLFYV